MEVKKRKNATKGERWNEIRDERQVEEKGVKKKKGLAN